MSLVFNKALGKSVEKRPPRFTVTDGTYDYEQDVLADGTVNWELALLSGTNATLTFQRVVGYIDAFLVAGGAKSDSGKGGNGGGCMTNTSVAVSSGTPYTFTVGGSDESTSIFGDTVSSGGGAAGGNGANSGSQTPAVAGADGVYAFGESTSLLYSGRKYGPGGGGGGVRYGNFVSAGKDGGNTGGGHGADESHKTEESASAEANTGGGGGGKGSSRWTSSYVEYYPAGLGGSGIIIIRNHRSS